MSQPVCRQTVTVTLPDGLHVRPLGLIARVARQFEGDVRLYKEDLGVDAKNVMEALTLNVPCGTTVLVEATGEGADEVVRRLVELFESNFDDGQSGGGE